MFTAFPWERFLLLRVCSLTSVSQTLVVKLLNNEINAIVEQNLIILKGEAVSLVQISIMVSMIPLPFPS